MLSTAYYENEHVRARMLEFLGGNSCADVTCRYISAGGRAESCRQPHFASELFSFLEQGHEISRSLWDRELLIADLDVEYVNFDHPAEAYLDPDRVFGLQRPVERVINKLLSSYGINPLHIVGGRGHHFVWSVAQSSRAFNRLARIGRSPPSLSKKYSEPHPPENKTVPAELGAAFAGLGMLMEFLAHRVKELAAGDCMIPVELTALEVGPQQRGREMISIDVSEYGDPLYARAIRLPFSFYLKPWQQRGVVGDSVAENLPPLFFIPLHEMDIQQGVKVMRDPQLAAELAERAHVRIPQQAAGMDKLVTAYTKSTLAKFHRHFYAEEHHPPEEWPQTYDRTPMDALPGCARCALSFPNDLLLRPAGMRLITRAMLALGWHPRHIAGLIRSKFERDHGWGGQWLGCDPATRADFYTRLFAGLFEAGPDDLVDFNCQSAKEEQLCLKPNCLDNLDLFKQSALTRRTNEQLAHRPFNRLFSPNEHS